MTTDERARRSAALCQGFDGRQALCDMIADREADIERLELMCQALYTDLDMRMAYDLGYEDCLSGRRADSDRAVTR